MSRGRSVLLHWCSPAIHAPVPAIQRRDNTEAASRLPNPPSRSRSLIAPTGTPSALFMEPPMAPIHNSVGQDATRISLSAVPKTLNRFPNCCQNPSSNPGIISISFLTGILTGTQPVSSCTYLSSAQLPLAFVPSSVVETSQVGALSCSIAASSSSTLSSPRSSNTVFVAKRLLFASTLLGSWFFFLDLRDFLPFEVLSVLGGWRRGVALFPFHP